METRNVAAAVLGFLVVSSAAGQSSRKKILVTGVGEGMIEQLKAGAPAEVEIVGAAPTQISAEIGDADALISGQITRQQLAAAKRLKWVQILNAGAEDYIPILKGTDVTLTNLKVVLGPEVADHAMALLLALTRGLYETIPARRWEVPRDVGRMTELHGKTAVIVGVGGVGSQIAERAVGFEMTVIGVDFKDAAPSAAVKQMVKPNQLDSVLPQADVVFVTVPETPATKGMIGAAQFGEMKRGAYFICVSRGTVYSMDGLIAALTNRRLAGAGLDVTDPEPLPADHPLWKFPNVVITPHIAGASDVASERVIELLEENIRLFASGQPLKNVVDKDKGY